MWLKCLLSVILWQFLLRTPPVSFSTLWSTLAFFQVLYSSKGWILVLYVLCCPVVIFCPHLVCCLTNAVFACVTSDSIRLTAGKKTTGPPSQKPGCVTVCSVAVQPAMGLVLSCCFIVFTGDSALLLLFGWPGEEVPCSNYHFWLNFWAWKWAFHFQITVLESGRYSISQKL